ncbi:hypothetical protein F4811DRAFT_466400 [Daldinia bambusicola]|nr:hypothetical protein F4811DRAFT_466400 [Daldinia bambusicola]
MLLTRRSRGVLRSRDILLLLMLSKPETYVLCIQRGHSMASFRYLVCRVQSASFLGAIGYNPQPIVSHIELHIFYTCRSMTRSSCDSKSIRGGWALSAVLQSAQRAMRLILH